MVFDIKETRLSPRRKLAVLGRLLSSVLFGILQSVFAMIYVCYVLNPVNTVSAMHKKLLERVKDVLRN